MKFCHTRNKISAFTLVETLLGILIASIVLIAGFAALNSIVIGKVKLIETTTIQKEAFYFSEKLFEMIKTGGILDYEEYWNRYSYDTTYGSGHFINQTGFGNFGQNTAARPLSLGSSDYGSFMYYCMSKNADRLGNSGCLQDYNTDIWGNDLHVDYQSTPQRYFQYQNQFLDVNSDADNDNGNEDGSPGAWNMLGDDDDLFLGRGPESFPSDTDVGELYLMNRDGNERTYFRYNVDIDPNAPTGSTCVGTQTMTGEGCLGTIEFLKLVGDDAGYDHINDDGPVDNDGIIDTWLIHPDFSGGVRVVAGSDNSDYWQPLFPDTMNVKDVQFYPYPNKNLEYSWRDPGDDINIAPYVRISLTMAPSWKNRNRIRGTTPEIQINTTVQLTDIFN